VGVVSGCWRTKCPRASFLSELARKLVRLNLRFISDFDWLKYVISYELGLLGPGGMNLKGGKEGHLLLNFGFGWGEIRWQTPGTKRHGPSSIKAGQNLASHFRCKFATCNVLNGGHASAHQTPRKILGR